MSRLMSESRLIHTIYSAAADPDEWPAVLTKVCDRIGAMGGLIAHRSRSGGGFLITGRLDPDLSVRYIQRYNRNVWSDVLARQPPHKIVHLRQFVDRQVLARTPFCDEILAPQRIVDSVGTVEPSLSGDGVGGFGFNLDQQQSDAALHVVARLSPLAGHLSRALALSLTLANHDASIRRLEAVLGLMPQGAFLLNKRGRVLFVNQAAATLLKSGDLFRLSSDGERILTAQPPPFAAALAREICHAAAIASSVERYDDASSPVAGIRPRDKGIAALLVIALPPSAFEKWDFDGSARVLVLAYHGTPARRVAERRLRELYDLTNAESRVSSRVGSGLSRASAASELGVSEETVKTHLRRSFAKLNIESSTQLANLTTVLSSMAGPSGDHQA